MQAVRLCVLGCLPFRAITTTGTLSAAAGEEHDGEDRISALPDELLCNIVSRLPIKDAVQTTALSPRWRRIWHSVPLVLYDAHLFPAPGPVRDDAIGRVLSGHPGPLRTVHLAYCFFGALEDDDDVLDKWARLLATGGVQDLVFINQPPPVDMPLPVDILRCTELRRLYLGFWSFPDTADLPDGAGVFPHLHELVLLNTLIDDCLLDHMLASSPALEMFGLVASYGLPKRVRLHGRNLKCMIFWMSMALELAVADAPSLKRLIMWYTCPPSGFDESDDESRMWVRIDSAPQLRVLGYLDPRVHKLQIGKTVVEADTKASPSSIVPSVKILALKVHLSVFTEVQMLASFLRCFPNIDTLHVESSMDNETTDNHYNEFFESLSPILCVRSNIKKVVVHEFRGLPSEGAFLKYITQSVSQLEKLILVLADEIFVPAGQDLLSDLVIPPWASKACITVLHLGPEVESRWNFQFRCASNLSIEDPFVSEHGQEVCCFIKKRE